MIEREVDFSELRTVVQKLRGLKAWGSKAGGCTGSIFTLQFGKMLADTPQWGDYSIMVSCAWRITKETDVLCTWHENPDAVLVPSLELLHGGEVRAAILSEWGDLRLELDNGFGLHVFADLPEKSDVNWFIGVSKKFYYSWSTNFTLVLEEH